MIDATVIIVSYNVRDLLARCLRSVASAAPGRVVEVVVVDNNSGDGTAELLHRDFPHVHLITNESNPGFAAASNQGAAVAQGSSLLFLNPDTEIQPGALEAMLDYLNENPDVGVVGPRLEYPDGRLQSSRRRFPTPLTTLIESTIVQRWWPGSPILSDYYVADRPDNATQAVDWLVGACLLVRASTLMAVGGFDEQFFMYSEEIDLCHRVRDAGWRVVYLPTARVIHHEGRSSEQNLARRSQSFNESKCLYVERYFGSAAARALRLFLLATTLVDLAEEATKLAVGHRPALRRARLQNLAQVASFQLRRLNGRPHAASSQTARSGS